MLSLLSNSSVCAQIGNAGPSDNVIRLSFNMANTIQNEGILKYLLKLMYMSTFGGVRQQCYHCCLTPR